VSQRRTLTLGLAGLALGLTVGLAAGAGRWPRASAASADAELVATLEAQNERIEALVAEEHRAAARAASMGQALAAAKKPDPGKAPPAERPRDPAAEAAIAAHLAQGRTILGAVVAGGGHWTEELRLQFRQEVFALPAAGQAELFGAMMAAMNEGKIEASQGSAVHQLLQ
jgi:hypothetical protein